MDEFDYLKDDVKRKIKDDTNTAKKIKRNVILATETEDEKKVRLRKEKKARETS